MSSPEGETDDTRGHHPSVEKVERRKTREITAPLTHTSKDPRHQKDHERVCGEEPPTSDPRDVHWGDPRGPTESLFLTQRGREEERERGTERTEREREG